MGSTHGRTTSGVACHHCLWAAHRVKRRWAWHAIIAFGLADIVGRRRAWHAILSPLDGKHGRTTSGVACDHRLWAAHTVERRWAWKNITAFGQHTRSNDVVRDLPTLPLDSTHGRTTSSVAFHCRLWAAHTVERRLAWNTIIAIGQHKRSNDIRRGMPSPPLDNTQGRMTSGVACHHNHWAAQTVEQHRA